MGGVGQPGAPATSTPLATLRWALPFLAPYRRRIIVLVVLSTLEVALRALSPWPLKAVVDDLAHPGVADIPVLSRIFSGPVPLLLTLVLAGLAIQVGHELVLLLHSRRQATLAQRLVFDLRAGVFSHLQYLALTHYEKFTTGDAVYRLERDTASLESILLGGLFPQIFSALTLVVMFIVLARRGRCRRRSSGRRGPPRCHRTRGGARGARGGCGGVRGHPASGIRYARVRARRGHLRRAEAADQHCARVSQERPGVVAR